MAAGGPGQVRQQLADQAVPHSCADEPGETTEDQDKLQPRVPAWGNKPSKPLAVKTCGCCGSGANFQSLRRVCWRDPKGLRMYIAHTPRNRHQKGPICLWEEREVMDGKWGESQASSIVPFLNHPNHTALQLSKVVCPTLVNT